MQITGSPHHLPILPAFTSARIHTFGCLPTLNRHKFPYRSKFPDSNNSLDRYNFSKQGRSRLYALAVGPTVSSRTRETPVFPALSGL